MYYIKDLFKLFYPELCAICETQLILGEKTLCTHCRHDLPLICYTDFKNNTISQTFFGRVPIEKAISFLFYRKEGKTKKIIHQLKYKNNQEIGIFIGNWFGEILKESQEFNDVDYIIPVPLHKKKQKQRGYNQLTKFGERLSKHLGIPYIENILIRTSSANTQTFKARFERFHNNETTFFLSDTSIFQNKHILLIDDVITTGATLEACSKELLKTENSKISIATMAFTE